MLCEKCHQNEALVFFSEVKNHQKQNHALCSECAKACSAYIQDPQFSYPLSFQELLSQLVSSLAQHPGPEAVQTQNPKCDFCGMTYHEFRQEGRFGCSKDYDLFEPFLEKAFMAIHGATKHSGKKPKGGDRMEKKVEPIDRLAKLHKELQEAIEQEWYEQAAIISREIKKLEGQQHGIE